MTVAPGHAVLADTTHLALSCVTNSVGQTVCSGGSAGFFAGLGALLFVYLAILVLSVVAAVKVVSKAGYSGWWVLITIVPLVGTVFIFVFAFSTWPVTKEVQMLRAQLAERQGYGGYRGGAGGGRGPVPPEDGAPGSTAVSGEYASAQQAALPAFGAFLSGGTLPVISPPGAPSAGPTTGLPPAGWYPNPEDPQGQLRYWDGSTWTDQFRLP